MACPFGLCFYRLIISYHWINLSFYFSLEKDGHFSLEGKGKDNTTYRYNPCSPITFKNDPNNRDDDDCESSKDISVSICII